MTKITIHVADKANTYRAKTKHPKTGKTIYATCTAGERLAAHALAAKIFPKFDLVGIYAEGGGIYEATEVRA